MNNSAWLLLADCVQLATWLVNLKLKEVKFGWTILKNSFTFDIYGVQCTFCIVFEVDLEKIPKIEHSSEYRHHANKPEGLTTNDYAMYPLTSYMEVT